MTNVQSGSQPLRRLFFAINHYISTADHIGEGVAMDAGDRLRVCIPVNLEMVQDREDWAAFRSRFDELAADFDTRLEDLDADGDMRLWTFLVDPNRLEDLATALMSRPGPAGWGSGKAVIDAHDWRE